VVKEWGGWLTGQGQKTWLYRADVLKDIWGGEMLEKILVNVRR